MVMPKAVKIIIAVVVLLGAVGVWVKNPGDIQSKILRSKAKAQKKAKSMMNAGKITEESIQKARECRQTLERIQRAKRAAEEKRGISGVTVTWEEVLPFMNEKEIPRCPAGGVYKLSPALQVPTCSISNNRTVDTADDHMVYF